MSTQVRTCPRCRQLMWLKEDQLEHPDEGSIRATCPHCKHAVTFKLVTEGQNAAGPKMGH